MDLALIRFSADSSFVQVLTSQVSLQSTDGTTIGLRLADTGRSVMLQLDQAVHPARIVPAEDEQTFAESP